MHPQNDNRTIDDPGFGALHDTATAMRRWPAWMMSAAFHFVVLLVLAITLRVTPRGAAPEPDRGAGIVLAEQRSETTSYYSDSDLARAAAASAASSSTELTTSVASALPSADELAIDIAGALPAADRFAGLGGSVGDAIADAGDLSTGTGGGPPRIGGDAKTSVFGVEGEGSRFVYVFDRSSSMLGFQGRPLAAAKNELIRSLQSLGATHQFQIIFYNNEFSVFNPNLPQPPRLLFADEENKKIARRFIMGISGAGGTRHLEPLRAAMGMSPDVIFFLSDAAGTELTSRDLNRIRQLNRGTSINTIEFGVGPPRDSDNFLVRLARQNNGKHAYVDVAQLPVK